MVACEFGDEDLGGFWGGGGRVCCRGRDGRGFEVGLVGGVAMGRGLVFLGWMHGFVSEAEVVQRKGQGYSWGGVFGVFSYRAVSAGAERCMDGGYGLGAVDVGR